MSDISNTQSLFQLAIALNIALVAVETVFTPVYTRAFELYNRAVADITESNSALSQSDDETAINEIFLRNVSLLRIYAKLSEYKNRDNKRIYWYIPYICTILSLIALAFLGAASLFNTPCFIYLIGFIGISLNVFPIAVAFERYKRSEKYVRGIEPEISKLFAKAQRSYNF